MDEIEALQIVIAKNEEKLAVAQARHEMLQEELATSTHLIDDTQALLNRLRQDLDAAIVDSPLPSPDDTARTEFARDSEQSIDEVIANIRLAYPHWNPDSKVRQRFGMFKYHAQRRGKTRKQSKTPANAEANLSLIPDTQESEDQ